MDDLEHLAECQRRLRTFRNQLRTAERRIPTLPFKEIMTLGQIVNGQVQENRAVFMKQLGLRESDLRHVIEILKP